MRPHALGTLSGQVDGWPHESHDHQHRDSEHKHNQIAPELTGAESWCGDAMPPRAKWEDDMALIAPAPAPRSPSATLPRPSGVRKARSAYVPEDTSTELIRQPETRPISQEQLIAEVKEIYAGLVMVENKCIEVENAQRSVRNDFIPHIFDSVASALVSANPAITRFRLALNPRIPRGFRKTSTEPLSILDFIYFYMSQIVKESDGELFKLVQMIEDVLDRLYKRFWGRKRQTLVYLLLFYYFFAEYPGGIRHLCTTMPWTIWPSLVVLWGVCWMFISPLQPSVDDNGMFLNLI